MQELTEIVGCSSKVSKNERIFTEKLTFWPRITHKVLNLERRPEGATYVEAFLDKDASDMLGF